MIPQGLASEGRSRRVHLRNSGGEVRSNFMKTVVTAALIKGFEAIVEL